MYFIINVENKYLVRFILLLFISNHHFCVLPFLSYPKASSLFRFTFPENSINIDISVVYVYIYIYIIGRYIIFTTTILSTVFDAKIKKKENHF